ncbi:DNA repair protein RadC [Aeromonas hydrophila]|uniref:JAB domain-containing protein n=1 Tax=Aeromonas hydrophila TaxID=644 RepID=UPI001FF23315|nr:DNA repair protein RadC [Aeromonas hydrophila]MCK0188039.1 DNA repair protein RadC [Aeromonas hydrophila]UOV93205.1 DNA repair protein RadC [Aeromonas hydrophila]
MAFIASDNNGLYQITEPVSREEIIQFAHALLSRQFRSRRKISSPDDVRQWLIMKLATEVRECFAAIFLSQQHHILDYETLFTGTLNQATVYPRELLQRALFHNAAAVILVHNHPSGESEPSQADINLTKTLMDVLALVDIRILDHMIIGGDNIYSFAEHKLL